MTPDSIISQCEIFMSRISSSKEVKNSLKVIGNLLALMEFANLTLDHCMPRYSESTLKVKHSQIIHVGCTNHGRPKYVTDKLACTKPKGSIKIAFELCFCD